MTLADLLVYQLVGGKLYLPWYTWLLVVALTTALVARWWR